VASWLDSVPGGNLGERERERKGLKQQQNKNRRERGREREKDSNHNKTKTGYEQIKRSDENDHLGWKRWRSSCLHPVWLKTVAIHIHIDI
jgi:hypothetical protein